MSDKKSKKKATKEEKGALVKRISAANLDKEETLTTDQKDQYSKIFKQFDADGSGDISTSELKKVLVHCKFTFDKIPGSEAWLMSLVDLDGTGTMSAGEFIHFVGLLEKCRALFLKADADKSGALDTKEIKALMDKQQYQFTDAQLKILTPLVDMNASGTLSCEEFILLSVFLRFCKIQFIMADTDGGGDISKKELLRYLPALGIQPNETTVDKYMKEFGVKDKLTFEQFALVAAKLKLE